jgi:oligopeptidase A
VQHVERAKNHHAALTMLRQVHFAMNDLALHNDARLAGFPSAFALERDMARRTQVDPSLTDAGGYAAGYYSYKWDEVLSADAYGAFREVAATTTGAPQQVQWAALGGKFRDTVLAMGGSVAPADVFHAFRGRAPQPAALLQSTGLL